MGEQELYASAEFLAECFNVDPRTIRNWVKAGNIPKDGRGQYPVKAAIAYAFSQDDLRNQKLRAEIRKIEADARCKELDVKQREGDLISLKEASAEIEEIMTKTRTRVASLPSRLALELAGISDPNQCELRIEEVCREILEEIHSDISDSDGADGEIN